MGKFTERNRNVAKSRGSEWNGNLIAGKLDARRNPSVLYDRRAQKKMSQEKITGLLGTSPSTYGAIERGKRKVSTEMAKKIAKVVGVEISTIFKQIKPGKYLALKPTA